MEDYRRRPPMEGFSRPGSLGGEAWNDEDSVEGHIMNDDLRQDDDTEGHRKLQATDDDDTEGHRKLQATDDDDTEGHAGRLQATDDDDTDGNAGRLQATDDDDTEGHAGRLA
ncbi:hypothetical protein BH23CHL9_BH23CHL9_07910 [soil metagenome]